MMVGRINIKPLLRDLARFPGELERTLKELTDSEARGFVKDAIEATPPFHSKAAPSVDNPGKFVTVSGVKARQAGEKRVEREAKALFVGVRIKGKRKLDHLFGKKNLKAGKKPPYVFNTTEVWKNVDEVWDARRAKAKRGLIGRGRRGAYYVDQRKLQASIRARKKSVGKLCAGWNAAAQKLGVKLPQWIARHGTKHGSCVPVIRRGGYSVRMTNTVPFASKLSLQKIADHAMKVRQGKLERRLPHVIAGAIRRAKREALRAA